MDNSTTSNEPYNLDLYKKQLRSAMNGVAWIRKKDLMHGTYTWGSIATPFLAEFFNITNARAYRFTNTNYSLQEDKLFANAKAIIVLEFAGAGGDIYLNIACPNLYTAYPLHNPEGYIAYVNHHAKKNTEFILFF